MQYSFSYRWLVTAGGLALASILAVVPPIAAAQPPPVEAYGRLPAIESPRLAPDGSAVAFLSSVGGRRCLVVHRLDEETGNGGLCPGQYEVRWFAWKNPARLILEVYSQAHASGSELRTQSRLIAIDLSGRHPVELTEPRPEQAVDFGQGQVIDLLPEDPRRVLVSEYRHGAESPDVERVDVESGRSRTLLSGQDRINGWKTDGAGQVRAGTALQDGMVRIYYRDDADSPFRVIKQVPASRASTFALLAIGDKAGQLYVASTEPTGRRAIYRYDVAQDRFIEPYASNPDVDVDTLVIDHGRPLGYGFTVDEPQLVYTDPSIRDDAAMVAKALPQFRTTIVDGTGDGRRLLIEAAGGNRPGSYYLLTRTSTTAVLAPLGAVRPEIPDAALAPVRPIAYRASDGLTIHGYVTLPPGAPAAPIPFVVMPHGGPSARDTLGFDYIAQMIASRGYGVLQPNFRGSRGYGGAFEEAGYQQWGLKMQDDITDGAHWLIDQKLADPKRICIVGWSYGGYAALMGAIKTPDLFRCAASMAGVTDLSRRLDRAGQSRFADLNLPRFDSDPQTVAANSPVLQAERIKIPILLAHGRRDFTVPVEDSQAMEAALRKAGKTVRSLYFDEDDHYLFREEDRIAFLKALEGFLADSLGAAAPR